jgi:hypothetical protein
LRHLSTTAATAFCARLFARACLITLGLRTLSLAENKPIECFVAAAQLLVEDRGLLRGCHRAGAARALTSALTSTDVATSACGRSA